MVTVTGAPSPDSNSRPLMKRLTPLLLLLFCSLSCAATFNNNKVTCPTVKELRLDEQRHWWATRRVRDLTSRNPKAMLHYKWYSVSSSLAHSVNRFAGAQYLGSTEGHVVCLYVPEVAYNTKTFPILVYFEFLSLRPGSSEWSADAKNSDLLNCVSNDPAHCPYLVYQPDRIDNPYESLRELG
jgi:hypothetical protein